VRPVDGEGKFTAEVPDYAGMQVFEANEPIIERLRASGALFKKDQIVHQYPYCWRTDKPLIYMAMSSWFVKVVELKKVLLDDNQLVNWIPEHIKDGRFGKWLDGARDWSISRNRFWGAPIPVWRSEDGEQIVIGSIAELAALSGKEVSDLHRPYVDIEFMRGGKVFRRVEDVFDCWFESGAMPFASVHYPFENKEFFERNFPADFIAEATDQTRGWFYTMAVLGVALFGKIPYKTCGVTGFIFDEKGQKLSKKLGNYSEPNEFFDKFGSDAFRWLLLASPVLKGEIARISKDGAEVAKAARRSTIPLYNAYHFFTLYANADGVEATYDKSSGALLDRYILAKTAELADVATKAMDRYDVASFCYEVEKFLDTLNNWYIRLSRERFWGTGVERARQQEAFNTLYSVLVDLSRLVAPVLPFTSEHIYRALCGGESVHLADWPKAEAVDTKLVEDMEAARAICSLVHTIRDFKGIPNRQPLAKLEVFGQVPHELLSIIAAESNVRNVGMSPALALPKLKSELYLITPVLGKKYGRGLADIQKAAKAGEYALADGVCKIAGYELAPGEYELKFSTLDERYSVTPDGRVIIELDTTITPELEFEGLMRDFMRAVQEERKNMGLDVADRIRLYYSGVSVPSEWAEEIKKTTLAVEFIEGEGVVAVPDTTIKFKIERA
jgi:isoleucyl-tRNA synthetase